MVRPLLSLLCLQAIKQTWPCISLIIKKSAHCVNSVSCLNKLVFSIPCFESRKFLFHPHAYTITHSFSQKPPPQAFPAGHPELFHFLPASLFLPVSLSSHFPASKPEGENTIFTGQTGSCSHPSSNWDWNFTPSLTSSTRGLQTQPPAKYYFGSRLTHQAYKLCSDIHDGQGAKREDRGQLSLLWLWAISFWVLWAPVCLSMKWSLNVARERKSPSTANVLALLSVCDYKIWPWGLQI